MDKRLRNLIAAFETERAEVDILRNEMQEAIDELPERLHKTEEQVVEEQDSLIEFPCDFPFKVMGASVPHFTETIGAAVREGAMAFLKREYKVARGYLLWYLLSRLINGDVLLKHAYFNAAWLCMAVCAALPMAVLMGQARRGQAIAKRVAPAIVPRRW